MTKRQALRAMLYGGIFQAFGFAQFKPNGNMIINVSEETTGVEFHRKGEIISFTMDEIWAALKK